MRNRGYKYIIKKNIYGYLMLCINATWINHMLKERGIRPRDFRKLTWQDIAYVQTQDSRRRLFELIRPRGFWEMCDTLALSYAEYEAPGDLSICSEERFSKYPIFTIEDVYELLRDRGFQEEDALRIMEFVRRGRCCQLKLSADEFMQLYDVPEDMQYVIKCCKYIPSREKVVASLLDSVERAMYIRKVHQDKSRESI